MKSEQLPHNCFFAEPLLTSHSFANFSQYSVLGSAGFSGPYIAVFIALPLLARLTAMSCVALGHGSLALMRTLTCSPAMMSVNFIYVYYPTKSKNPAPTVLGQGGVFNCLDYADGAALKDTFTNDSGRLTARAKRCSARITIALRTKKSACCSLIRMLGDSRS